MSTPQDPETDTLRAFADRVAASPHNLVSRRARGELLDRHIPECLHLARLLPPGPAKLLDVGSGGGFPGLVIAIARPDLEVHLLDSTAKKTAFLAETAEGLDVQVAVHTGRAEELASGALSGSFDLVTARAVAPLDRLIGWTVPFLRPGGRLFAMKGARWSEELTAARDALHRFGASVVSTPEPGEQEPVDHGQETSPRVVIIARNS